MPVNVQLEINFSHLYLVEMYLPPNNVAAAAADDADSGVGGDAVINDNDNQHAEIVCLVATVYGTLTRSICQCVIKDRY